MTQGSTAFTPGPWRDGNEAIRVNIERSNPWAGTVFRVSEMSDERALVAMVFGPDPETAAATARLIAAAHEMHAALETASWLLADISPNGLAKQKVDAALAKASPSSLSRPA